MTVCLLAWLALAPLPPVQDVPEVRQLVTFKFSPGKSREAVALFRDEALPLYQATAPMLRFRGFREAESPEPLDLIVVSTFHGMAGMDASNRTLRERAEKANTSMGELYARIGALTEHHRDEFIEIAPELSWGSTDTAPLVVLVSIRIAPGKSASYQTLVREHLVPWEKKLGSEFTGSDGGQFLLSSGWDYVRLIGISTLGDWHRYVRDRRAQAFWSELDGLVTQSKEIILAPLPELAVR
jgi:hypothetical protein